MLSKLNRPAFIIFDYGETLAHEDGFHPDRGFAAIMEYAVENPLQANAESLLKAFRECFMDLRLRAHGAGVEIPNQLRWKWLFEMYGLRFSLNPDDLERVYWDAAAPCAPTPGMSGLLERLRACGVGTGVVSNMGFSGASLTARLERLFPGHRFHFVISSADYVLRKPDRHIFDLALKKAGCTAAEAWFAGDNPGMDIVGAAGAGILPVYYDRDLGCAYREPSHPPVMPPHVRITDWPQLYPLFQP